MITKDKKPYPLPLSLPSIFQFDGTILTSRFQQTLETVDNFEFLTIQGQVLNEQGCPQPKVLVEMWHTLNMDGIYGMEYGPSAIPMDANRQGWQCTTTDNNGRYELKACYPSPRHLQDSLNFKITDQEKNIKLARLYLYETIFEPSDPFLLDMELEERRQYFGKKTDHCYRFNIQFTLPC